MRRVFSSIYLVLFLAILWLLVRIAIGHFTHYQASSGSKWGVLLQILFILLAISLAMTHAHQQRQYGFLNLFKKAAKYSILYSLSGTLMLVIYYNWISDEMLIKQQQYIALIIESLDTKEEFQKIIQENPALKGHTVEQLKTKAIERSILFTKLSSMASLGGLALIITSLIYSLIAGWLFDTFLFKAKKQ
jgi:hypothetical protein